MSDGSNSALRFLACMVVIILSVGLVRLVGECAFAASSLCRIANVLERMEEGGAR